MVTGEWWRSNVDKWSVYTIGNPGGKQELVGIAVKKGFETVFDLSIPASSCVYTAAIQANVEVRRSNTVCF